MRDSSPNIEDTFSRFARNSLRGVLAFDEFAGAFSIATGFDLYCCGRPGNKWAAVTARIGSRRCRHIPCDQATCARCQAAFQNLCERSAAMPPGEFVSCDCFAGKRFSLVRLPALDVGDLQLLVGRVQVRRGGNGSSGTVSEHRYAATLRLVEKLLPMLCDCLADRPAVPPHEGGSTVDLACRYIQEHFAEDMYVKEIAFECGVSTDWLTHHFRRQTGQTVLDYLARVRVEHASKLLRQTTLPIVEIAFDSGYQSLSQFNRVFLRLQGMVPRAYRKFAAQQAGLRIIDCRVLS